MKILIILLLAALLVLFFYSMPGYAVKKIFNAWYGLHIELASGKNASFTHEKYIKDILGCLTEVPWQKYEKLVDS